MTLWHKDFIGWPHWAPQPVGKDILEKVTAGQPWFKASSCDLKPLAIKIVENFAFIYYRFRYVGGDNVNYSGRIGHIWMKQDGKWEILGGYSGGGNTQE
jgi:hypothetical protein